MAKYVVFAGADNQSREEIVGYIKNWMNRGVLKRNLIKGHVAKPGHLDIWFSEDETIKRKLREMNLPERFYVIKVEVKNRSLLEKEVSHFCRDYSLQYRIY